MKTPKRTIPCPQCGAPCELGISVIESWDERYEVPALFCTRSGEEVVGNAKAICARWTRKNREARLRHKIAVLQELVTELEHDCKERYEAVEELLQRDKDNCHEIAALKSANSELAIWLKQLCEKKSPDLLNKQPINRLMEKYAHERHRVPYSTYGQDVEGS